MVFTLPPYAHVNSGAASTVSGSSIPPRCTASVQRAGPPCHFYWLHIPKCGSTFLATIVDIACPSELARHYTNKSAMLPGKLFRRIEKKSPEFLTPCAKDDTNTVISTSHEKLDLVLRARCAVSEYFSVDSDIGLPFIASPKAHREWFSDRAWESNDGSCGSMPMRYLQRAPFDLTSVAVMMREPFSRLISSYLYSLHDLTVGNTTRVEQIGRLHPTRRVVFFALHACSMQTRMLAGAVSKKAHALWDSPEAYPSGAPADGCTAAGLEHGLRRLQKIGGLSSNQEQTASWNDFVQQRKRGVLAWQARESGLVVSAIERMQSAAFVGITNDWARSICVFYRMYGLRGSAAGGEAQLGKARAQNSEQDLIDGANARAALLAEGLNKDRFDDPVFQIAKKLFDGRAKRHKC